MGKTSKINRTNSSLSRKSHHYLEHSSFPNVNGQRQRRSSASDSGRDPDNNIGQTNEEEGNNDNSSGNSSNNFNATRDHDKRSVNSLEREIMTLKDRQEAMNKNHPFGLPIWKPALYKKSRSVVRSANKALHSSPSSAPELFLNPGNILWLILFGWWISLVILVSSIAIMFVPSNGPEYGRVLRELSFYVLWPFGRYVERHVELTPSQTSETTSNEILGDFEDSDEETGLLTNKSTLKNKRSFNDSIIAFINLGPAGYVYYLFFYSVIAPILLLVSAICWMCVISIPMAKLNYILVRHLNRHPLSLRFKSNPSGLSHLDANTSGNPAVILLCTYQAIGMQYYKYTFDGINILFINLMPLVFFVIFDEYILKHYLPEGTFITSPTFVFTLSLASVIPLSYFIGMGVSSISAQSSMGVGAVINATFGSIIEIILYAVALISGKSALVEGALIGSFLAGVLLMPGCSMISGAVKQKEQKFNAKSAGVTSTMLIMAIIGALTPTLFYQMFGSFELRCLGCPSDSYNNGTISCSRCYYDQLDPAKDPIYQNSVKPLMWLCAAILPTAYIIGLVFSLHTHVEMVWNSDKKPSQTAATYYQKLMPSHIISQLIHNQQAPTTETVTPHMPEQQSLHDNAGYSNGMQYGSTSQLIAFPSPSMDTFHNNFSSQTDLKFTDTLSIPTASKAIDEATASSDYSSHPALATTFVPAPLTKVNPQDILFEEDGDEEEGAGHDSPNWGKNKSFIILFGCTILYSIIAEILVDTVDEVMKNFPMDEKFLGLTLFALVPNITEFMNAISFALYGNIVLSMEIGSAYALQVCLLQIPAMVAFSVWYNFGKEELARFTFNLVFPRWDVIAVIFSVFLLTYTYQEGKANYFKGSILIMSYVVLVAGFYFIPTFSEHSVLVGLPSV